MSTVRYNPDIAGTGRLMRSPEMLEVVKEVARRGEAIARSIAPVRTGDYEASFRVEGKSRGGPSKDRAEARLVNDSPHAVLVEWYDDDHVLARTAGYLESTAR